MLESEQDPGWAAQAVALIATSAADELTRFVRPPTLPFAICPMAVRHRSSVRCSSLHDHRLEPLLVPEKDLACGGRLAPRLGEWRFSGTHTSTPRHCGTGTQCDGASLECRTTTQS